MKRIITIVALIPLLFIIGCGQGGSEAGNPPSSRIVTGNLTSTASSSSSLSLLKYHTDPQSDTESNNLSDTCEADLVIAFDSAGGFTQASANADCSFDLSLETDKAYEVNFFLNDEFVAYLVMMNNDGDFDSPIMFVSEGDESINLGRITIIDFMAFPENQPASQNDRDRDGTFDFDDDDDDNDGRRDRDERDCDLDGFRDDFDDFFSEDFDCEGGDDTGPEILNVNPWDGEEFVPLDELVMVLFSCELNSDTVNATNFKVEDSLGNAITCNYLIDIDIAICEHDADPFLDNTEYTATISGVKCSDDQTLPIVSWSWNTGADTI